MKLIKKMMILSVAVGFGILPSFAKIEGKIFKGHFYDTEKTIMTEASTDKEIKTGKYWEKNLLYFGKYKPLFMLSNKDLYNLMPKEKVSISQRIATPSIYSVSLKTNSIKAISLTQPAAAKKHSNAEKTIQANSKKQDNSLLAKYEEAKNPQTEPETKLDVAMLLKDSKLPANYDLAIDLLNDVIKKEPYNALAFCTKGEIYSQKDDFDNAMQNYIEALRLNPASKQSYLGIAKILEPTNKELAQKYYEKAK